MHEVGHLFGLPDLYPYDGTESKAGCWSIMSDIFHAVSFLGWHRHKTGWLAPSRVMYIAESTPAWHTTLSPLSGAGGMSLMVLSADDVRRPTKVFAVELAQPVLGSNGESWGEGVLVYTVDATIPTDSSPVAMIPQLVSRSPDYGYLFEAPYGVGDVAQVDGSPVLTVRVLQKFGSSYRITIEYHR